MSYQQLDARNQTARLGSMARARKRQSGAVLVVSLILLLVLTLISVSSMQGTTLEEKMAGNSLDRNLAFQATESTVREAEQSIESIASLGGFDGTAGRFGLTQVEPDPVYSATWTDTSQHVTATENFGSYTAPKYYIKHFTTVAGNEGALNLSGYGDNKGTGDVSVFKIGARGTGGSADSAEVILRTYYGRIF